MEDTNKWGDLKKKVEAPKDEIIVIVDRSGSMNGIIEDAVGGINALITANKEVGKPANITFVKFDNVIDIEESADLATFRDITVEDVHPRGGTAMNDAIGMTLAGFEPENEGALIEVVIVTDGGENSSVEYRDRAVIKKMIEERQKLDNWTFTFLAANMDAFAEGSSFGIAAGTTQSFDATSRGITAAYHYAATETVSRRSSAIPQAHQPDNGVDLSDIIAQQQDNSHNQ